MNKKTYVIAIIVLILDQVSKSIIEVFWKLNESVKVIDNFFRITVVHNTGGAWSILEDSGIFFIIVSIVALIILIKYMFCFKNNLRNNLAFAFTIGGIISNLADRIFLGYVRDFLDFNIFNYNYPIFNIADIGIVLGIIMLAIAVIKGEDKLDRDSK